VCPAAPGDEARKRGDVDDAAETVGQHAGQDAVGQFARPVQQHLQEVALVGPAGIGIGAGQAIAGVVDQDVGGAAVRRQVVEDAAGRLGIGEIGLDGQGLDTRAKADLLGQTFQPIASAGGQGEVVAVVGEDAREGRTYACRSPRHQRQSAVHLSSPGGRGRN
jgi:hypothetical protein